MRKALLLALLIIPGLASAERSQSFGAFQVHYNAVPTGMLQPQVAADYGIVRSRQRGLLTVALLRDDKPVAATIQAAATDSQDSDHPINMRQIREDESVYYIGTFEASAGDKLTFQVSVKPRSASPNGAPFEVGFVQRFFNAE